MECLECQTEMEIETAVSDYYDPSDLHGHGQHEQEFWVCPTCDNQKPLEEL